LEVGAVVGAKVVIQVFLFLFSLRKICKFLVAQTPKRERERERERERGKGLFVSYMPSTANPNLPQWDGVRIETRNLRAEA